MFPLKELPKDFLSLIYNSSKYFSELQIEVIENNIERFLKKIDNDSKQLSELQYVVAKSYISRFKIKPIDSNKEIVGATNLQVKLI